MRKWIVSVPLVLCLATSAMALEVPTDTVVQNLNGSQQVVKTYTVAADVDPQTLIEDTFELEGYAYTFSDIVKNENSVSDVKRHTETVTVETADKDLATVLEQLAPTMEYDDGVYSGTLALDHTSIQTEAAGYTSKSYTVTETKVISQLDRNDMSYVPATTVKNGMTLALANVEWQIQATALVDDALIPSQYQAVATYSGTGRSNVATGYVTTAAYVGDVAHTGVESVTYTLTYLGTETGDSEGWASRLESVGRFVTSELFLAVVCVLEAIVVIILSVLLARARRDVRLLRAFIFEPEEDELADEPEQEDDA